MPIEMGALLNERYRVLRPLGAGGMGEVYLGDDEREGRQVAVKALRLELLDRSGQLFLRRFREEVEILQRLRAPGVPAFVDAFEQGNRSFLIMEYIEGHSLDALLERSREQGVGGLRPSLVAQVGIQVCRILEHLHGQTPPLIHRDIKPSNIIIRSQDDQVFLVDFGLAREFHDESGARTLVGTVGYSPLEQFQGQPEPRSDLYALGATMFELVTGCAPKPLRIPAVQSVLPSVPDDLARLINLCVRATPEERPTDAVCLRLLLEEALANVDVNPAPPEMAIPTDRIEQLIQRWGRGKQTIAAPLPEPEPPPELPKPLKIKKFEPPQRWTGVLVALVLVAVTLGIWQYRGQQRYLAEQRELVEDGLSQGMPGPGWSVRQARGLFPAQGLGLGEPNRDWDRSPQSGVIYSGGQMRASMSFSIRRLKGSPRLLVFCSPWGLLFQPGKDKYELKVVSVGPNLSLENSPVDEGNLPHLNLGNFRRVSVRLSVSKGKGHLVVDRRPAVSFSAEDWGAQQCGAILLNASENARCLLEDWQLQ